MGLVSTAVLSPLYNIINFKFNKGFSVACYVLCNFAGEAVRGKAVRLQ